jgi:hypothetical protein
MTAGAQMCNTRISGTRPCEQAAPWACIVSCPECGARRTFNCLTHREQLASGRMLCRFCRDENRTNRLKLLSSRRLSELLPDGAG